MPPMPPRPSSAPRSGGAGSSSAGSSGTAPEPAFSKSGAVVGGLAPGRAQPFTLAGHRSPSPIGPPG
eukprot:15366133-Alexandrium_andersonii.AAC.1